MRLIREKQSKDEGLWKELAAPVHIAYAQNLAEVMWKLVICQDLFL